MERSRVEIAVSKTLQTWLEDYNVFSWLNEGEDKFYVKGTKKRPDLLIYSPKIKQFIAVEIKTGKSAKDIYDAGKILDYYAQYIKGEAKYFIEDKQVYVDSFAVATLFSMFGKLFLDEGNPISIELHKEDNWKKVNKELKLEPLWEYPRTHDYTRHLWSRWREIREKRKMPGVGVILSDVLNKREFTEQVDSPILFDMQYEDKWRVRQKWL